LSYNGKEVFRNLSFEIKLGEKVVISGKSGSGKSSLFSMLLGFIEPGKGEVTFDGIPVDEKNAWDIRKKTAYIDQDVSIGSGKILDTLDFVSGLKTNARLDHTNEKINDLLEYFELNSDVIYKNIEELSGGERQRLSIVISILLERNIFLLDEVTSALDKHLKNKVVDYFVDRKDWSCLIISHDPVWLYNPSTKVFDLEERKWRQ
jgi:putative ABC transport system ATP-binding protein